MGDIVVMVPHEDTIGYSVYKAHVWGYPSAKVASRGEVFIQLMPREKHLPIMRFSLGKDDAVSLATTILSTAIRERR